MLGNLTSLLESEDAVVASHSYVAPHAVSLSHVGRLKDLCVCTKSAHLYLTPCNPMDCSLPGSSVHGILQGQCTSGVVWDLRKTRLLGFPGGASKEPACSAGGTRDVGSIPESERSLG